MDNFVTVRTVLGEKKIARNTAVLAHEHICCYSKDLHMMSENYLSKAELIQQSADVLKCMKEQYDLGLFIDCTPLNIGRDIEVLKKVSECSGVDIVCSTGFYYQDEPILNCMSAETLSDFIAEDAKRVCAGVIKAAVEYEDLFDFNVKLLKAAAIAQKKTGLPIVLHTNAQNKNGMKAVRILLNEAVSPKCISVGHLSDTDDLEYIEAIAKLGCFVALDRLYDNRSEEYVQSKMKQITTLCELGYENQILLSHDDAVFMGFHESPKLKEPRWNYMFDCILPKLERKSAQTILRENPISMLCGN